MENYSIQLGYFDELNEPMIKITNDGFWVRNVKVEQDADEAINVYNAFKEFLSKNTSYNV